MNEDSQQHVREFTALAVELAEAGVEMAFEMMGKTNSHLKADRSVVTEADVRVQDMIIERIRREFPDHGILAEEQSDQVGDDETDREFVWAIDPIDGTRNYAARIPIFACSIALMHHGRPIAGAVTFPQPKMVFHTNIYEPVKLNDEVVAVADRRFDIDSILCVSGSQLDQPPSWLARWAGRHIVRDFGSVAWHLALAAAGRIDAVINLKGCLWDIAAGALLVSRAGGRVVTLDGCGRPCDSNPWPLDLRTYRRQSLPSVVCSAAAASGLIEDMSR